jgi:GDP/UDP-N,N'-diacetylbacillosamine 2-epimerase (hydrolysing)
MSHLHFVAAEEYRQRVMQLGENPEHVHLVGGLGIDNINRLKLLDRSELETLLGFEFGQKSLLITFHPATLEAATAAAEMSELLAALADLKDTQLIFTMPNADTDSRELIRLVEQFTTRHPNACAFTSLGYLRYLSCVAQVDGVIGNSSSGLLEVPSFRKGTINIGDRQKGRLQAGSVINCKPSRLDIAAALEKLYSAEFQADLSQVRNPYGEGGASKRVVAVLARQSLDGLGKKSFFAYSSH